MVAAEPFCGIEQTAAVLYPMEEVNLGNGFEPMSKQSDDDDDENSTRWKSLMWHYVEYCNRCRRPSEGFHAQGIMPLGDGQVSKGTGLIIPQVPTS